jgi:copper chaperone CopZ
MLEGKVPLRGILELHEKGGDMAGFENSTVEYKVTGMTCGHCEASVRSEVSKLAGVEDVQVSAAAGTLRIVSTAELADDAVIAAVDEAGYSAVRA